MGDLSLRSFPDLLPPPPPPPPLPPPSTLPRSVSPSPPHPPTKSAKMGRMHNPHKGIAGSALPYKRSAPRWLKTSPEEIKEQIFKLARKGLTPSQIGVILRDSHG